ncbi:MAG: SAM-dependent methyltransferase [Rhodospirillales bacterium]
MSGAGVNVDGVTGLADILHRRIAQTGPLTLAEYMAEALMHPVHGYYVARNPFGAAGDFITAPDISQMFGELIGAWLAHAWLAAGSPSPFALVELGPGRGALMADLLRATRGVPGFHEAARLHLVEASASLRAVQQERLAGHGLTGQGPEGHGPVWLDRVADLPDLPLFIIGNEFLDALPVRQFVRQAGGQSAGWAEVCVGSDGERFHYARKSAPDATLLIDPVLIDAPAGTVVEICPAARSVARDLATGLRDHGGAALLIDYGYVGPLPGDSFQAMAGHGFVDPLATPGRADLTAHVDFGAIRTVFADSGVRNTAIATQGDWLRALGIESRLAVLAEKAGPEQGVALKSGCDRLIGEKGMGTLFKVFGAASDRISTLPGFG